MLKRIITGCSVFLLCACGANKKEVLQSMRDSNLLQEKKVNDYVFRLQYMPQEAITEDTALVYFRLNVSNSDGKAMNGSNDLSFSYGLDTLFSFVTATDTITPTDVNRIANGTMNGAEYMLVFDKQTVYAQRESKLLFKDWLFTKQTISFPVSGSAISHIDSLSLKL